MRVGLDVIDGDRATYATISGAVQACREMAATELAFKIIRALFNYSQFNNS